MKTPRHLSSCLFGSLLLLAGCQSRPEVERQAPPPAEESVTSTRDDGTEVLETGTWTGVIEVGPAGPPDSKAAGWTVVRLVPTDGSPAHILDMATDDALRDLDGATVEIIGAVIMPPPRTDIATLGGPFLEVDSFSLVGEASGPLELPMDTGFESHYSDTIELFEADVRVDPQPGGKMFQGVWLDRDAGDSYLVDYRATPEWTAYEGQRVEIAGRRYSPGHNTQHITNAQHFEVQYVAAAPEPDMAPTFTGEPETLVGTVAAGGGSGKSQVLVHLELDDGTSRILSYGRLDFWSTLDGKRVEITGRPFEPGHAQQASGEHLWPDTVKALD